MKVAFWLNAYNKNINYLDAEVPNPGIGGTEYLFWTTSYFIKKMHSDIDVYIFSNGEGPFPQELIHVNYLKEVEVFEKCREDSIDYLVIRGPYITEIMSTNICFYKQKTIVWSHNLENYISIKRLESNPFIVKNVCVSNEQLYWLKDTDLYKKSTYIYNGMFFKEYQNISISKEPLKICYIGNLYPRSGIETVAKAWKKIKRVVPDAKLCIIGGNNLYNIELMKKGYSKKSFTRLNRLLNKTFYENGELCKDIQFTGILRGREKLEVMASAQVGIANITDSGDTFGLGAVEFQALGVPVVSIGKYGVLDTVDDMKTGLLSNNKNDLAKKVVQLLNDLKLSNKLGEEAKSFVYKKFEISKIADQWVELLDDVKDYKADVFQDNRQYEFKRILDMNAKLRSLKLFRWLKPVAFYKYVKYGIRRVLEKIELI